ncbi:MAG: hypothetical protein ABI315_09795 [Bacteroidia bacterium]
MWQYGCNELKDVIWEQDGVAPQCKIENIDLNPTKGGRVYIPPEVKKGFVESYTIGNYGWIFKQEKDESVKKRN